MSMEMDEEERRYEEAADDEARVLDAHVLEDPVRVLKPQPAIQVGPDETVAAAVRRMDESHNGCVLVVEGGRLVGIFTERDAVTRVLATGADAGKTPIRDVMTAEPERLGPDETLGFALHKMSVGSFRHLPVVDADGMPTGVLSQKEGVKYLVGFFPEAVINQPPRSIEQRPPRNQYGG